MKTLSACPVCGGRGRHDAPDLAQLDATCSACGWHYTSHAAAARAADNTRRERLETTPADRHQQQARALAQELGKAAATRAWTQARARGEPPAGYPPINAWLHLADELKRRGWVDWLDRTVHSAFCAAYRDGLEALASDDKATSEGSG